MDMLAPKFYDFDFLIQRKLLNVLTLATELYFKDNENLEIVDIGCGDEPYFQLFEKNAQQYIGIDMKKSEFVDIIGSAERLPFVDNYFGVALSTQALEHIFEYMAVQRPILVTGGSGDDMAKELLDEINAGAYAPTVEDIKSILRELYSEYKLRGKLSYNGDLEKINKYSYREMARKFAEILDGLIQKDQGVDK